jgi:hypothetical protein
MESEYSLPPPADNPNGVPVTPTVKQVVNAVQVENDRLRAELAKVTAQQHQQQQQAARLEANQQHLNQQQQQQQHMLAAPPPPLPPVQRQSLPKPIPPKRFGGDGSEYPAWKRAMERYLRRCGVVDGQTAVDIVVELVTPDVLTTLGDEFDDLSALFGAMDALFHSALAKETRQRALLLVKRSGEYGEYVRAFFHALDALPAEDKPRVDWVRCVFLLNLCDNNGEVAFRRAMSQAQSVEDLRTACFTEVGLSTASPVSEGMHVDALSLSAPVCTHFLQGQCKFGARCRRRHLSFDELKRENMCGHCGLVGHVRRSCPKRSSTSTNTSNTRGRSPNAGGEGAAL